MRTIKLLLLAALLASCADATSEEDRVDLATLADPGTDVRPWVRWWWPGGDVDTPTATLDLDAIAAAGFGGVEIQAFDAALDPELSETARARVNDVRSPRFDSVLNDVIAHADTLGLGVDLTIGSGWPVGGTHVPVESASTTLMWWERTFEGPTPIDTSVSPLPSVFFTIADIAEATLGERLGRFLPDLADPIAAFAAPVVEGGRAASPLVLTDTVVLDRERLVDLSDALDGRTLRWSVPRGRWHVIVVFAGPAGDYLTLTAEPGDPYAVDHLDAAAVSAALDGWFANVAPSAAWRGVFNDSLEFKLDRLFTDDLLDEFEARRGYALGPEILLALSQSADSFLLDAGRVRVAPEFRFGPDDDALRWDYRLTVSELFIERFVGEAARWSEARGLGLRSQSYGIDVDVIAALGAAHTPESETLYAGGSRLFHKMAASAAHLYGRPRASAEAFSFILRDHMTTPLKLRAVADQMLLSGINELVFHGWPYPAAGTYGVTGWTAFSSPHGGTSTFGSSFGPRWEFSAALPELNDYIARSQHLARVGAPSADILVVYPHLGFPTSLALVESHVEPLMGGHIDGEPVSRDVPFAELASLLGDPVDDPRALWLADAYAALDPIERCGRTWDWVNPASLERLEVGEEGGLTVEGARYRGVVVFDTPALSVRALAELERLAAAGVPLAFVGERPARSPSRADHLRGDDVGARVEALVAGGVASGLDVGELPAALDAWFGASPTDCGGQQRALVRHVDGTPVAFFVANLNGEPSTQSWALPQCARPTRYDAWSHRAQPFDGTMALPAYGAAWVVCDAVNPPSPALGAPEGAADRVVDAWSLDVASVLGGAGWRGEVSPAGDWREDAALAGLSGEGAYTASVEVPGGSVTLALDWVYGVARVELGDDVRTLSVPPWRVTFEDVPAGQHTLRVVVTPPIRNELLAAGLAEDPLYAQFAGKEGSAVASGLRGAARLWFSED